ncbi:hypothetical protein D9758_012156 [Tetrapyrgos nigripes]|uniref:NAD-capped RNA hydrolase RAI1 n=1 Tax=Tetrapyrgos nigripes TaxID=182062 RepID=A0A8H5CGX4_9AGAR|nr:hypothetical protein D9758_012156 [Tetrapyrgos nigripes]
MSKKRDILDVLNEEELAIGPAPTRARPSSESDHASQSLTSESKSQLSQLPEPKRLSFPDTSSRPTKAVPFQLPTQVISFSYTPEHVQEFTNSALRYFSEPPLGAQLGYGYERWIRRPEERGRIDSLLKAFDRVKNEGKSPVSLDDIGVVSWRGVMTRILTAPYEDQDGWEMNVMFVNGTMYLEEHLTEAKLHEKYVFYSLGVLVFVTEALTHRNNMEPRHRKFMYYGYAFESFCTSEKPPDSGPAKSSSSTALHPTAPTGWGGDIDTNVQWCSVVRTKLGDIRLVIGGEVDCVRGKYTGNTDTFVELKTSIVIRNEQSEAKFEKKLLKFYFQSFLLGVPEILVGFRTVSGQLSTTQSFKTIEIPRMVRGKLGAWDPAICLDWGYQFLTFLKDTVTKGDPENVWRVKFLPKRGVHVTRLDSAEVAVVENGEERKGILPFWYWARIRATTSPSPPMTFLQPVSAASLSPSSSQTEGIERENRKKAVQKFLARAELSNVTHALRTRLSYASYKATNNVTNVPFRELEAQSQTPFPALPSSRSNAAKRKAPGGAHYYNPSTQPGHGMSAMPGTLRRGSTGPPGPSSSLNPRPHYPSTINDNIGASSSTSPTASEQPANPNAPTLFSSILAPPPANQARTILNAYDPPVPAPIRPAPSPRVRSPKVVRSQAEGSRSHGKSRHTDRDKTEKRKEREREKRKASSRKGKRSRKARNDEDGDVDMEAAATLTSLLLHHRPSIASASSPRSSVDSSDAASSYSQFPQASSRTFPSGPSTSVAQNASTSSVTTDTSSYRSRTPPAGTSNRAQSSTPRPAPTDNEAADLMLFLATSPSPARLSNKDAKDLAAFRALGSSSGVMRAKGRVLFPTHSQSSLPGDSVPSSEADDSGRRTPRPPGAGTALMRGTSGENSFASSMSSIGGEMGLSRQGSASGTFDRNIVTKTTASAGSQSAPRIIAQNVPTSTAASSGSPGQAHLLPPPSLPATTVAGAAAPPSPRGSRAIPNPSPATVTSEASGSFGGGNGYRTISPAPRAPGNAEQQPQQHLPPQRRADHGLRADLGRKLFEEEQMRAGVNLLAGQQRRVDDRNLDTGVDMVKT